MSDCRTMRKRRLSTRSAMNSAIRCEEKHRKRLQGQDEADRGGRMGDREHQPGLSDGLHPRPDEGCALSKEESPEVWNCECGECSATDRHEPGHRACGRSSPAVHPGRSRSARSSRMGSASASVARSLASRSRSRRDSASFRSERIRSSSRLPLGVAVTRQTRLSTSSRMRRRRPAASSFGIRARASSG